MTLDELSLIDILDVVDRIARMHDDAVISPAFAAIYLGVSEKTLSRYRQTKSGPPYTQYPVDGSRSRNQKVNYVMRDLRAWRGKHKVSSTMEAAVLRGMAFVTMSAMRSEQPFFIEHGQVLRHALQSSKKQFSALLRKNTHLVWMSWDTALKLPWAPRNPWLKVLREKVLLLMPESQPPVLKYPQKTEQAKKQKSALNQDEALIRWLKVEDVVI